MVIQHQLLPQHLAGVEVTSSVVLSNSMRVVLLTTSFSGALDKKSTATLWPKKSSNALVEIITQLLQYHDLKRHDSQVSPLLACRLKALIWDERWRDGYESYVWLFPLSHFKAFCNLSDISKAFEELFMNFNFKLICFYIASNRAIGTWCLSSSVRICHRVKLGHN